MERRVAHPGLYIWAGMKSPTLFENKNKVPSPSFEEHRLRRRATLIILSYFQVKSIVLQKHQPETH